MVRSLIDFLVFPFGPFAVGALIAAIGGLLVASWAHSDRDRAGDLLEAVVLYFALWIGTPMIILGWLMFSGLTRGRERAATGRLEPFVLGTLGNLFVALVASELAQTLLKLL
jgi:hypothetical protein